MNASRESALGLLSVLFLFAACGDSRSSSSGEGGSTSASSTGGTTMTGGGGAGGSMVGVGGSGGMTSGVGGSGGMTGGGGAGGAPPCVNDSDCGAASFCSGGSCVPKQGNGQPCSAVNACLSGFCVDGVCCDSVCDGPCAACDGSGSAGVCSPAPAGSPSGAGACIPYVCDGAKTTCPASCMTINDCVGACGGGNQCTPPSGGHVWSKRFGDPAFQIPEAMFVDGAGNVTLAGYFSGTVDFGGGPLMSAGGNDIFVAKLDASGNHVWSVRFGGTKGDTATAMAVDPQGNVYVAGTFNDKVDFGGGPLTSAGLQDVFVLKLNLAGAFQWAKRFGSPGSESAKAIAFTPTGLLLAGEFAANLDLGGGALTPVGGFDLYLAGLDANGGHLWSKSFGGIDTEGLEALTVDASGGCVLTGFYTGSVDFGGGALVSAGVDAFVARLDANGGHIWSKRFGDAAFQAGQEVAFDAGGALLITGFNDGVIDLGGGPITSKGKEDIFLAKLDAKGDHVWSKGFGDPGSQIGWTVAVDSGGNVVLGGSMEGTVDFGTGPLTSLSQEDAFIAKFDPSGVPLWSRRFGGSSIQHVQADGSRYITASAPLLNTIDFGGGLLSVSGNPDVVVARLLP